jgi:hypothetical protein
MADAVLNVFRGDKNGGAPVDYKVPIAPGMVVLDALNYIQTLSRSSGAVDAGRKWFVLGGGMEGQPMQDAWIPQRMNRSRCDLKTSQIRIGRRWSYTVTRRFAVSAEAWNELEVLGRCGPCRIESIITVPERCHVLRDRDMKAQFADPGFLCASRGWRCSRLMAFRGRKC